MSDLMTAAVIVLFGGLLILSALALQAFVAALRRQITHPTAAELLQALTPWLYRAVLAGEHAALLGLRQADSLLTGADKAEVANRLYDLLPDTLIVSGKSIPISLVKALITRERFAALVKDVYDSAHAFLLRNEAYLLDQMDQIANADNSNPSGLTKGA